MTLPDLEFVRPWAWWLVLAIPLVLAAGRWIARGRPSQRLLAGLRAVTLVLLVATLSGPLVVSGTHRTTTVFVVDRSASVQPGSREAANAWIRDALDAAGTDDSAAIVSFGSEPDLTVPSSETSAINDDWQDVGTIGETTDIASALSLARSLPVGDNRRIVLLSDGAGNVGDALEQADQAGTDGVPIDVVPLSGVDPADLRMQQITGPSALWQGDDLPLLVTIGSGGGGAATLELVVDGTVVLTKEVTLSPGQSVYSIAAPALEPGFHAVQVRVTGEGGTDRIAENNLAYHVVQVRERPVVLLVAPIGSDPVRLEQALTEQGADVSVVTPDQVPTRLSELSSYDAVVLDNVPAWELTEAQQASIVANTEAGNGLIVIGGSAAYGPGSYAGTTLEQAMPVTVKVVDGQRRPTVAVLIVMDKSGSMSYDPRDGDTAKIDLAKDGVVTAASALAPGDQLGVIAFNDEPIWALPMTTITGTGDLGRVEDSLASLSADGGTELYPALQVAYDNLRNVDADVRHIILLSDGKSRSGTRDTYTRLVNDLGKDNITLSTVALGTDADLELLEFLSTEGGGRYHYANKPEEIPEITFQEAQDAGSQSVLRGAFTPVQMQSSPILNGIDPAQMPSVDGYNFAEGRENAQVDLVSDRGDPLLAKWQLGLGRVVAWTADDGSDYAAGWAEWPQFNQFWGQALRWTLPDPTNQAITATMTREGDDAVIAVDSQTDDGDAIDLQGAEMEVTQPDGTATAVTLTNVSPGLYEARIPNPPEGAWQFTLDNGEVAMSGAIQVSPEWLPSADGAAHLEDIAQRTGGEVRLLDTAPDGSLWTMADDGNRAPGSVRAVWYYPLVAALAFFVAEVAIRQARMWTAGEDRATATGGRPTTYNRG
jgi:Ca-activated chloride channel homolog